MDHSSLSIFVASPQQTEVTRRRSWESPWSMGMDSVDEYLQRDLDMEKTECANNGKFTTWVLAPRDDPQTLDFLSSCETFRRVGLTARENPEANTSDPLIEEVVCYGIASVFTAPKYRNKGYGRLMMCLLHWVLAGNNLDSNEFPAHLWGLKPIIPPGMGDAVFSVLYSDVGDFYERCGPTSATGNKDGWIMRGTWTTRWLPRKHPASEGIQSDLVAEWKWLDHKVLDQLWTHDNELMRSDLRESWHTLRSKGEAPKALFTFLPSGGVEGFQRGIRLRVFWKNGAEITRCGIVLMPVTASDPTTSEQGSSNVDSSPATSISAPPSAFATWSFSLFPGDPRTLLITRLRAPTISHLASILQHIWTLSQEHNIEVIEVWNFPTHLRGAGYDCIRKWFDFGKEKGLEKKLESDEEEFERKEHLPAFKWYERGISSGSGIEWAFNERFCWC